MSMKATYPQTYNYILDAVECGKVIYELSSFNDKEKVEILNLFLHEIDRSRLNELQDIALNQDDPYKSIILMEATILNQKHSHLRDKALQSIWDKYETELDDILDEAEVDHYFSMGGVSQQEEWLQDDINQRLKEMALDPVQYH